MKDMYSDLNPEQVGSVRADINTVVAAGAGSGKTTVLARRYARLIKEGLADVESILTLTFTRKAAAEMHLRIYGLLKEGSDDPRLKTEAVRFDLSRISTLDSFSSSVVRNWSGAFGIPSGFSLDENEAMLLTNREALSFLLENGERPSLEYLIRMNGFQKVLEGFSELGRSYFVAGTERDFPRMHEEQMRILAEDREALLSKVQEAADGIRGLDLSGAPGKNGENARSVQTELAGLEDGAGWEEIARIVKPVRKPGAVSDPDLASFKEYLGVLKDHLEMVRPIDDTLALRPLLEDLFLLLGVFQRKIQYAKRASGVLTFRDSAELAVTILRENKDLRSFYKKKFKAIMIDEFQDNNRLQKDLLYLLAEREDILCDGIPPPDSLDPRKLFFVGDEKQSIYRFRGADVRVFKGLSSELEALGGKALRLDTNYRSDPGLLEFFNLLFAGVMAEEGGSGFDARFESLRAPEGAVKLPGGPPVSLFYKPYKKKDETADDEAASGEAEAYFLARRIHDWVEDRSLPVRGGTGPRPAEYRDFAVLMRSTGNQIVYERMFRLFDVPYSTKSIRSLFMEAPVNDIYCLLQIVVYPEDRTAYAAVLRSPFVNMGDDGVLTILLREEGPFAAADPAGLDEQNRLKYEAAGALYAELLDKASSVPVPALLSFLWHEAGYRFSLLRAPARHPYLELYDYLLEFALRVPGETLSSFLDRVRPNLGQYEKIPDLDVQRDEAEGVQILSIHMSKGLEYPVVVIANAGNIGRSSGKGGDLFYDSEKYGLSFNLGDKGGRHNYFFDLGREEAEAAETAELKRLFYVACTRAESRLVISGCFTKNNRKSGKSFLPMTFDALGLDQEAGPSSPGAATPLYQIEIIPDVPESELFRRSPSGPAAGPDAEEFYGRNAAARLIEKAEYTVTEIAELLQDHAPPEDPGVPLPATAADGLLADDGEAYFGSLCHLVIEERLRRRKRASPEPLRTRCPNPEKYPLLLSEAERIAGLTLSSPFFRELIENALTVESELPFLSRVELGEGSIRVRGQIDFLAVLPDRVVVLDFKTDRMRAPRRHRVQLGLYGEAAGEIWGRPAETRLVYLRSGEVVTLEPVSGSERQLLADLLKRR